MVDKDKSEREATSPLFNHHHQTKDTNTVDDRSSQDIARHEDLTIPLNKVKDPSLGTSSSLASLAAYDGSGSSSSSSNEDGIDWMSSEMKNGWQDQRPHGGIYDYRQSWYIEDWVFDKEYRRSRMWGTS